MDNLSRARHLLESGKYTCVVCKEDTVYTTSHRGVAPLLNWLDAGVNLKDFSAADRVVGRGAAFLYCLLGVKEVHALVMSHPASQVLRAYGIGASADTFVEGIVNRTGTGPCPFEAAVLEIQDAEKALIAIRRKRKQMQEEHKKEQPNP